MCVCIYICVCRYIYVYIYIYLHTMGNCPVLKKIEIMPFATTWIDQRFILSEVSQTKRNIIWYHMWNLKYDTSKLFYKTETHRKTGQIGESRPELKGGNFEYWNPGVYSRENMASWIGRVGEGVEWSGRADEGVAGEEAEVILGRH